MSDYLWPLNNSTKPDEMNTSFGPRIDLDGWDFHDGIDLPRPCGTNVHAMGAGKVRHAGLGGTGGISSRHVVITVTDPHDGPIDNLYLHLASIDPAIVTARTWFKDSSSALSAATTQHTVICIWSSGRAHLGRLAAFIR